MSASEVAASSLPGGTVTWSATVAVRMICRSSTTGAGADPRGRALPGLVADACHWCGRPGRGSVGRRRSGGGFIGRRRRGIGRRSLVEARTCGRGGVRRRRAGGDEAASPTRVTSPRQRPVPAGSAVAELAWLRWHSVHSGHAHAGAPSGAGVGRTDASASTGGRPSPALALRTEAGAAADARRTVTIAHRHPQGRHPRVGGASGTGARSEPVDEVAERLQVAQGLTPRRAPCPFPADRRGESALQDLVEVLVRGRKDDPEQGVQFTDRQSGKR